MQVVEKEKFRWKKRKKLGLFGPLLPSRETANQKRARGEKRIGPVSTGDGWVAELVAQLETSRAMKALEFKPFLSRQCPFLKKRLFVSVNRNKAGNTRKESMTKSKSIVIPFCKHYVRKINGKAVKELLKGLHLFSKLNKFLK